MSSPIPTLTIARPDDWHLHLRDGPELAAVLPATARAFARAVVMPNLKPPVTTVASAAAYRDRIRAALPAGADFEPLMTLYLTDATTPAEIDRVADSGFVVGVKCYPAGSDDAFRCRRHFARRAARRPSRAWRSATSSSSSTAKRPATTSIPTTARASSSSASSRRSSARHPRLRIVLEHVTTRAGAEFVRAAGPRVAATLTPQHLLLNRGAMFRGGLRPHLYCLPVLKRERDREALLEAATSDDPRFFLGTDSAPHAQGAKESSCGCAGVYSAPVAIELYARAFEQAGRLDRLESFASLRGADFYGLPRNRGTLTLERRAWPVPASAAVRAGRDRADVRRGNARVADCRGDRTA